MNLTNLGANYRPLKMSFDTDALKPYIDKYGSVFLVNFDVIVTNKGKLNYGLVGLERNKVGIGWYMTPVHIYDHDMHKDKVSTEVQETLKEFFKGVVS